MAEEKSQKQKEEQKRRDFPEEIKRNKDFDGDSLIPRIPKDQIPSPTDKDKEKE